MDKHTGCASPQNHLKLLKVIMWRSMWEALLLISDSDLSKITLKRALSLCKATSTKRNKNVK